MVIGITGSNGKTSVKEMLASILRLDDEVLATRGNYNNELGVPLSLFELEEKHRYAVLEMGASKAGDIAYLAGIARPDVGLVTNIGPAHLKALARKKGWPGPKVSCSPPFHRRDGPSLTPMSRGRSSGWKATRPDMF